VENAEVSQRKEDRKIEPSPLRRFLYSLLFPSFLFSARPPRSPRLCGEKDADTSLINGQRILKSGLTNDLPLSHP
jgi:hypothetical protein